MSQAIPQKILNSSFRDPSGFVFSKDGILYRQVNKSYSENYDLLMESGLYKSLTEKELLIPHAETDFLKSDLAYKIIKPEKISFISYPYEWSFSMLKDAALATLQIQKNALDSGMSLKDASAYNIQFFNGKPILIDTLSFEKYLEGRPWISYQQFCRHFLAPLALMSLVDVRLNKLSYIHIDGIPLDLAAKLLPFHARFNVGLMMHIFLHSRSQVSHASDGKSDVGKLSRTGLLGIIDSLQNTVSSLNFKTPATEWGDYYSDTNYSEESMNKKLRQVEDFILKTNSKTVWDLGANNGRFSRLASKNGLNTVAFDVDPVAVELNYIECRSSGEELLLPLLQDLTNPSSGIGFSGNERDSLLDRGPADTVLALALIHHLSITNNIPFYKSAEFFSKCGNNLIIEFVPKEDSQVKRLLASREDIFDEYTADKFESVYGEFFSILEKTDIQGTQRKLYLMKKGSK